MAKRNKARLRLHPTARRLYDLQQEATSLSRKLKNLIDKVQRIEAEALAFEAMERAQADDKPPGGA